jgi:hypothetical protein
MEICHLSKSVNPGIGPSGSFQTHTLTENLSQCRFEHTLDRQLTRLELPPVEMRSIVLNDKLVVQTAETDGLPAIFRE